MKRVDTNRADTVSRRVSLGRAPRGLVTAGALVTALAACGDASIGVLESGPSRRLEVELGGPASSLGAWRYYDGVRLLECDVRLEAWGEGGSNDARADWLDGVVDLYDLRSGEYLGSDYMYASEVRWLWGASEIENGERQLARPLRYTSYGPFRAWVTMYYEAGGAAAEATHRFDCR